MTNYGTPLWPGYGTTWARMVQEGLISGEPSYYWSGKATDHEYYNALAVAMLEMNDRIKTLEPPVEPPTTGVTPPNPDHYSNVVDLSNYQGTITAESDTYYHSGNIQRFIARNVDHVALVDTEVTGAVTGSQVGAVAIEPADDVIMYNIYVHRNDGVGVQVRDATNVHLWDSTISYNGQLGIGGWGRNGDNAEHIGGSVIGCTISNNNPDKAYNWGWEAGGTKFWSANGLVVRDNVAKDNWGPGLWFDHDNINCVIENNECVGNAANGIFWEISYGCIIRGNYLARNGFDHAAWLWGGGIVIATSHGTSDEPIIIEDNELVANWNGISVTQQNRGAGLFGPYESGNIVVRNNVVMHGMDGANNASGAVQDNSDMRLFNSIEFIGNRYEAGHQFAWNNGWHNVASWRGYHPEDAV